MRPKNVTSAHKAIKPGALSRSCRDDLSAELGTPKGQALSAQVVAGVKFKDGLKEGQSSFPSNNLAIG